MSRLFCISKSGGYRDDIIKKIEQVGFEVTPIEPTPKETLEEAKKSNPDLFVIDFSGSPKDSKVTCQVGQELFKEFRNKPFYLIGVDNRQKEMTKIRIPKGKFVEEKALYRTIKSHLEEEAAKEAGEKEATPPPAKETTKEPAKEPAKKEAKSEKPKKTASAKKETKEAPKKGKEKAEKSSKTEKPKKTESPKKAEKKAEKKSESTGKKTGKGSKKGKKA